MTRYYLACIDDDTFDDYIEQRPGGYEAAGWGIFLTMEVWDNHTYRAELIDYERDEL